MSDDVRLCTQEELDAMERRADGMDSAMGMTHLDHDLEFRRMLRTARAGLPDTERPSDAVVREVRGDPEVMAAFAEYDRHGRTMDADKVIRTVLRIAARETVRTRSGLVAKTEDT